MSLPLDRFGPIPLYRQIASELRSDILRGRYGPGVALPSERKLMEGFDVTRSTVRNALAELRNEGLVVMEQGAGAFVRSTPPVRRIVGPQRFPSATSVDGDGADVARRSQVYAVTRERAEGEVAERLAVDPGTPVVRRHRRYWADEWPMQLGTSYIPYELARGTPIMQRKSGPGGIHERLRERGHPIGSFLEEVTARMPTPDERSELRIPDGVPVLRVVRTAHEVGTERVLELFLGVLPADRYVLAYPFPADA
jgi:GntR family transcriptional regulator